MVPNAASVALIEGERVLLIQRGKAPWRGMWSLPGGRLEPGEDAEACATRELKEELGLNVYALRKLTTLRLGDDGKFLLQVFATEAFEGEVVPQEGEISAWRLVTRDQAALLPTTPHLNEVLGGAFRLFDRS
jgi:8-oxo-dGTP diphosphatase